MRIEHILVTTDLSQEAMRPCASIAEIARNRGARITLLHVVTEQSGLPHGAPFAPAIESPKLEKRLQEARLKLEEQGKAFGEMPITVEVVSGERTAEAIGEYARTHDVDMIALSTHGRTGFRHLVVGSVAETLLRKSPVPVLVFPRAK